MLAVVKLPLMSTLSDVDRIVERVIEGTPREDHTSSLTSCGAGPSFAANARVFQTFCEFPNASTLKICEKYVLDRDRLLGVDDQSSINSVVAFGHMASHPHTLQSMLIGAGETTNFSALCRMMRRMTRSLSDAMACVSSSHGIRLPTRHACQQSGK
jgi:hypothetical protein